MTSASFDLSDSIIPRSDQINAEDILTGPRTITIADVKRGTDEQPVDIVTEEFGPGRPYKPSKTMRRVIVSAWGPDASQYIGRRLTIYRDPEITFGRDKVGGIRISNMSHIDKRMTIALTVTRGKRAQFTVEPLREETPPAKPAAIDADAVAEFERDIANAATVKQLDEVAKDLKASDLGAHHNRLLTAWKERRAAITDADA
jgi:hypothetical protein